MKSFALITTALVFSGSILSVATAAPPSDVPTAVVKFGDLDTTRQAGQEQLYRRLTQASHSVCESLDPSGSVSKAFLAPLYKACVDRAISGAVAKINRLEFTAYVASRTPTPNRPSIQLAAQ